MHRAFRVSTGLCAGLIILVLLPGCRQGTFLGNRYNNFRAYYNTFYNAQKAFDAGEEALELSERQIDRSRFVFVFPATQSGASSGGAQFEQAIEKSADLLRERPDSKWADDALLLIGKAYFYQNNFVGAEGKFRETVEAALERDQLELADEARFWLGRTLAGSERYEEASSVLEEGLARPDIRPKWRSKLRLALGELHVQQRQWADAAEALRIGIPETEEKDLSGRAQFLLGQVLEADGRYEEAAAAYADVAHHRPIYELSYAAKLSEALVLGVDAGNTAQALGLIRGMRRDGKNFQNRAEVELAYARLLGAADQPDEAEQRFNMLLYDEDFRANNVRGEAYYRYAEFFRDEANDYMRAAAYFDTAATNVRSEPGREELVTRVALRDVRRSAEVYRSYASIATELAETDSLLYLGTLGAEDFRTAIAAIESERIRQWEDEQRILAERRAGQGFGNTPIARGGEFPVEGDEGGRAFGVETGIEAGFLNYRDPARSQDALLAFERVWGERALAPNWRRLQALQSAVVEGSGPEAGGDQGQGNQGNATGPPPLDISDVPRTDEAQARVRSQRAELRYELGNVFFLSLAKPDSAAYWYGLVVSQDADQPVVTRARYALAEVHGAQGRDAEAEVLYRQVIADQPLSAQAAQARERLGLPPLEQETILDARALAEIAYDQAYGLWQGGSHSEAIGQMLDIGARASDDDVSPRALLVSGLIFTEWVRRDSLNLEPGIPGELVPEGLLDEVLLLPEADDAAPEEETEAPGEPDEEMLNGPGEGGEEGQDLPQKPGLLVPPQIAGGDDPREQAPAEPQTPDLPTDVLAFDPPGIDSPGIDSLTIDSPGIDSLGIESPAIDSLGIESPAIDSLGIDSLGIESPAIDSPGVDSLAIDSLAFNPPAIDASGIDSLTIDSLTIDSLGIDSLGVDSPAIDSPGIDSPGIDSPAIDSLAIGLPEEGARPEVSPDSLGGQIVFLSLDNLYRLVEARYPDTEYAAHARARRAALDAVLNAVEGVREPGEDSLDAVVDVMAPLPQEVVDAAPEGTFGLAGDVPLNADVGGFGWKVASVPSPLAAQAMLRNFSGRGLRAAVVQETEDRRDLYVLILGQFASVEEAEAARDDLPATGIGSVLEIIPIRGLDLMGAADLDRLRPD